jgi:hypothetical protein
MISVQVRQECGFLIFPFHIAAFSGAVNVVLSETHQGNRHEGFGK